MYSYIYICVCVIYIYIYIDIYIYTFSLFVYVLRYIYIYIYIYICLCVFFFIRNDVLRRSCFKLTHFMVQYPLGVIKVSKLHVIISLCLSYLGIKF